MVADSVWVDNDVDFATPITTKSGRYWYNLHLVLVTSGRYRIAKAQSFAHLRDVSLRIAAKKGLQIGNLSAMPDHLHLALRGNINSSPQEITLSFQNNLAYAMRQGRIWADGFYVGSFSEYTVGAVIHE